MSTITYNRYRHTISCLLEPEIAKVFLGSHTDNSSRQRGVYVDAQAYDTYVVNVAVHIAWLYKQIAALGGRVIDKSVQHIGDARTNSLGEATAVVVNATGRNAARVAKDASIVGISGQVMRVHAPDCRYVFYHETQCHGIGYRVRVCSDYCLVCIRTSFCTVSSQRLPV